MPIEVLEVVHSHYIGACCFQPWQFIVFALLLFSVAAVIYIYFAVTVRGAADLWLTYIRCEE